jgi:hypothetical protein
VCSVQRAACNVQCTVCSAVQCRAPALLPPPDPRLEISRLDNRENDRSVSERSGHRESCTRAVDPAVGRDPEVANKPKLRPRPTTNERTLQKSFSKAQALL